MSWYSIHGMHKPGSESPCPGPRPSTVAAACPAGVRCIELEAQCPGHGSPLRGDRGHRAAADSDVTEGDS